MKQLIIIAICWLMSTAALGQQQALFTQFMFNKASINPAYVGNDGFVSINGVFRQQWIGLDGAPAVQIINAHGPIPNQNAGVGIEINRQSLGVSQFLTVHGNYAYKLQIMGGQLSLGARASYRNYQIDYSDERINATTNINQDQAVQNSRQSKGILNGGFGAYFNTEEYYIGFALPRIFKANLDFEDDGINGVEATQLYAMTGISIEINENFSFVPQLLVRYVPNTPLDFDLNFGAKIQSRHVAALNYRAGGDLQSFGESIGIILGTSLGRELFTSIAYDISLSKIRTHASGSIELSVNYQFGSKPLAKDYFNPRFF